MQAVVLRFVAFVHQDFERHIGKPVSYTHLDVYKRQDLDLGLLREKFTPEQVIGALACAAGLTDTAEPVAAKELVKAFSWEKIPKHELYLPNVFRDIEKN